MQQRVLTLAMMLLLAGCGQTPEPQPTPSDNDPSTTQVATKPVYIPDSPTEAKLRKMGLVDILEIDSTILVNLIYATPHNFTGQVLYTDLHKAFLLPELANAVAAAQQSLHRSRPDLNLVILDAARPLSVQSRMFHLVQGTPLNIYVANPLNGPGLHNYGAAVDISLADSNGNLLPMGTDIDHFGPESHIDRENELLSSGRITQEEYDNRRLLRRVLKEQKLLTLRSEWWHFTLMSREKAQRTLKAID